MPITRRIAICFALLGTLPGTTAGEAAGHVSPVAHEVALRAAIPLLPPVLREFVESHREEILKSAAAMEVSGPEAHQHQVFLDVTASSRDWAELHRAARAFPRNRAEAEALMRRQGLREPGVLPWAIVEQHRLLVLAFRAGTKEVLIDHLGRLLHLATDAALPFQTTVAAWSDKTVSLSLSHRDGVDGEALRRSRRFLHVEVFEALGERPIFETAVHPSRAIGVRDVESVVFDLLLDAHRSLADVERIMQRGFAALAREGEPARPTIDWLRGPELLDALAPLCRSRLEAAAIHGAGLIDAAWVSAGRPALPVRETLREAVVVPTPVTPPPAAASEGFVGSGSSTVFHRPGCAHAARIKPANLVRFRRVEDARAAGRTPCRTCKPDA